jgi:hypothetical protein
MKSNRVETITLSEIEKELDIRLENLEIGTTQLYSWEEVKAHIIRIRQINNSEN